MCGGNSSTFVLILKQFDKAGGYWAVCSAIADDPSPVLPQELGMPLLADLIAKWYDCLQSGV